MSAPHLLVFTVEGARFDSIEEQAIEIGRKYCGWDRTEARKWFETGAELTVTMLPPGGRYSRQRWQAEVRWSV